MHNHDPHSSLNSFSPQLAEKNPAAFRDFAIEYMGQKSTYGAAIWNQMVEQGHVVPARITIDTTTWHSMSNARGYMKLGTKPMSVAEKDRIFLFSERFTYADEVARRLLHETAHSLFTANQHESNMHDLISLATSARRATGGRKGLSALGSLNYYASSEDKAIEDVTELLTMYAWDPDYLYELTDVLADSKLDSIREEVGLISITDDSPIYGIVASAVERAISSER